mmetsp:Transcript_9981/g.13034  ORF Transcript_9981/g.13034 Transcript_9981/m.13034 type:complete len:96 (+) Transcript_9981:634-921(+)
MRSVKRKQLPIPTEAYFEAWSSLGILAEANEQIDVRASLHESDAVNISVRAANHYLNHGLHHLKQLEGRLSSSGDANRERIKKRFLSSSIPPQWA